MEVDPGAALEAQRKAHPELGEQLDKMQKYMTTKLSDTEPFGVDFPFDPC